MSISADLVISLLALHRQGRTGVVTIRAEGGTTFVYLREGVVVFAEEGTQGETLGRLLVRQGLLSQQRYVDVIGKMTDGFVVNEQLRFGEVAIELGYLSKEQVQTALRDQVRWKVIRALQRRETVWEFEDSRSRVEEAGNFPMALEALVLEAVRWIDDDDKMELGLANARDKALTVPSEERPGLAQRFGLTAAEAAVVARLDGTRTVCELLDAENGAAIDTPALLTALLLTRVVKPAQASAARAPAPARPSPPVIATAALIAPHSGAAPAPRSAETAPAPSPKAPMRKTPSRASQILRALDAQRVKVDPLRAPASDPEAKLLAERAFQSGIEHMKFGRYRRASADLHRATQLAPTSLEYRLYDKWCSLRGQGQTPHALELGELRRMATAAISNDPNFAFGCCVLGELALGDGQDHQALRMLRRATKLDPHLLEAQRLLRMLERRLETDKG